MPVDSAPPGGVWVVDEEVSMLGRRKRTLGTVWTAWILAATVGAEPLPAAGPVSSEP